MARSTRLARVTPLARFRFGLQRERALIALFDLGRQKSWGMRAARLYAYSVGISYAVLLLLVGGGHRTAAMHELVRAALVSLSWAVGALGALGAARTLAEQPSRAALEALALQRGIAPSAFPRAQVLAAALRIARLVAVPALVLVAVAAARGANLRWAASMAAALALYATVLGACLGLLAAFAAELSPRRPRALLAALVLVPLFAAQAYPAIPSLPGFFGRLLSLLLSQAEALS